MWYQYQTMNEIQATVIQGEKGMQTVQRIFAGREWVWDKKNPQQHCVGKDPALLKTHRDQDR